MSVELSEPLKVAEYERHAEGTDKLDGLLDTPLLGLVGEIGSLLSALKKRRRDTDAFFGYQNAVVEELGDVLWYISAVARRHGTSLAEVAARLLEKTPSVEASDVTFAEIASSAIASPAHTDEALEKALLRLAGEAGDLAKRFIEQAYMRNVDGLRGDLIKLMRPLIAASIAVDASLEKAATENIAKIEDRWPTATAAYPALFDDGLHADEQLPRLIRMEVFEREVRGKIFAFQKCNGLLIGDRLTDNHMEPDDYRFHDVFHLAYTAILGWSPVTRALFRVKRKSFPKIDENEDGARAGLIEEGLTTWIFETAKQHQFFGNTPQLGFDLLKGVKAFVHGYEPQELPMWLWERAILQGYAVFRELRAHRRGVVIADMAAREVRFERLPN